MDIQNLEDGVILQDPLTGAENPIKGNYAPYQIYQPGDIIKYDGKSFVALRRGCINLDYPLWIEIVPRPCTKNKDEQIAALETQNAELLKRIEVLEQDKYSREADEYDRNR